MMKAAFYTEQGDARDVLQVSEIDEILPQKGEVQIRILYSGVNPGEVKKRSDEFSTGMPYDMIIPHSDGAGFITGIGENVDRSWLGKKVSCFGAQSYRQFGTAAEYCCVPVDNVIELDESVDMRQAGQMGIPGITAHRAVHIGGSGLRQDRSGQVVLIQGGSGAVGQCAIAIAKRAGAMVLTTVRAESEVKLAEMAGADKAYLANETLKEDLLSDFPDGIDHVVEVAFAANIETDASILKQGGTIAAFATNESPVKLPFWTLVFSNITVYFIGSDDFPHETKIAAMQDLTEALSQGWKGLFIGKEYDLDDIAEAHLHVEGKKPGRAIVRINSY